MSTNYKGDLALSKTISDLTTKGLNIFIPLSSSLYVDLMALDSNRPIRIQVKHSINGLIRNTSTSCTSSGLKDRRKYEEDDFDIYAAYLSQIDKVVYVPLSLGGSTIRYILPDTNKRFYWYEDFLDIPTESEPIKRTTKEFKDIPYVAVTAEKRARPEKEILELLVWQKSKDEIAKEYNVSNSIVSRWCNLYNINCPPRGYWLKQNWSVSEK